MRSLFVMTSLVLLVGMTGCSRTTGILTVTAPDGRVIYQDDRRRAAQWAMQDNELLAVLAATPVQGGVCEPYPALERFYEVYISALVDQSGATGEMRVVMGRETERLAVDNVTLAAMRAIVVAHDERCSVAVEIDGPPEKDLDVLRDRCGLEGNWGREEREANL
jgi:hypothetical protein